MTNLSKFLSEIAGGLFEQATGLSGDDPAAETSVSMALRDYGSQLHAVADAVDDAGAVEWSRLEDRIGLDLDPEPRPLIRVAFGRADVESMAHEAAVPVRTAVIRAEQWGRPIEQTATELCSAQLLSVIASGQP